MNRNFIFSLFFVLSLFTFVALPVNAQEEQQDAQYVVQPGDTLSKIALRFNISVDELTAANGISNPNQLFVGDVLILPGVDWIEGVLDVSDVPVGETFRSLRRRYKLDDSHLGRVSGVVSPSQVYAGYPLMLPTGIGEDLVSARAAISTGESFLGLAAKTGENPWTVAAANQFRGLWTGIRGDIVFLPGTNQPGPGGLPSPLTLAVRKGDFIQGKTTVLEVGPERQVNELSGEFLGHTLNFFEYNENLVALQGVHVMTDPGPYMLSLKGSLADGSSFSFSQLVRVKTGDYESEKITVDPLYLNEEVDNAETAFVRTFTTQVTPEKLWAGYFEKPTPFDIYINSFFGTRRSYNGSDYTYFHSGIDFGGGQGADVIAPAVGRVVFTGSLEVRGNATIIDHGWGIFTGYWHQSEILVQEGDMVTPGQIIGKVGNTGRSSGAHLHWELWAGGIQVEPYDWLIEVFP
jgi:murein DD-endopeptidase MepM/ murein hydrolase activator NlpD